MNEDFLLSRLPGYGRSYLTEEDIAYLGSFWLSMPELKHSWAERIASSFTIDQRPVRVRTGREVDVRIAGCLFDEEDFVEFCSRGVDLGEKSFVVVEDSGSVDPLEGPNRKFFRFRFPLDVSWRRFAHGAPIAEDFVLRPIRSFFVVSDNGRIGKYVDNDADRPFELYFERHEKRSMSK